MDVPFPTSDMNPWMWVAGVTITIAIAVAGFAKIQGDKYSKQVEQRIARCEGREDRLIEDNRTCLAGTKDLLAAAVRATELAETTVDLHRITDGKIDANSRSIEDLRRVLSDVQRALEEMRRQR